MMKQFLKKNRQVLSVGIALFMLSAFFRFWQLGSVPVGLYWDETAMFVDAKSIAETGKDMHGVSALQAMFSSYGDYKLPMYIWFASLSFKLFGASDFALRLPNAVAGLFQGLLIFFLLKELTRQHFSNRQSLITSFTGWFVLAVSPWSVLFSRTGFEGYIGQVFVTASVLCLFLSKRSLKWLIPATLLGIAAVYSYYSVRFVWPVLLITFAVMTLVTSKQLKIYLKMVPLYLLCLTIWGVGILPIFLSPSYAASQQFRLSTNSLMELGPYSIQSNVYREMSGNTFLSRFFYHQRILQMKDLLEHYSDHFDLSYLFITGDSNLRHSTGNHGLFLLFSLPLLLAGSVWLLKKNVPLFLFLAVWWLIALLPASVPVETPHALRSLNALSPIILIMAFGIVPLLKLHLLIKPPVLQRMFNAIIVLVVMVDVLWFVFDYFHIYPKKSSTDWQQGYKQLAQVVDEKYKKYDTVWVNANDDRFFLWYLAYSRVETNNIQEAMKDKVLLEQIDNIIFRRFPYNEMEAVRPFMTVTNYKEEEKESKASSEQFILDSYGQPKFVVRFYEK